MTSHSYYKDRLGFDPDDVNYELSSTTVKRKATTTSSSSSHHHHHHQHQHQQPHHHHHHHHHSRHERVYEHRASPQQHAQHSSQSTYTRISVPPTHNSGGVTYATTHAHDVHDSGINQAKKAKSSTPTAADASANSQQLPSGGYEDALSQFKGIMSMWELFIVNWDIIRKFITSRVSLRCVDVVFLLSFVVST